MEERLQRIKVLLGASSALVLAACSGAAQAPPATSSVNTVSSSYAKLEFAVGTATLYGVPGAGLNVVSSYRQAGGKSAVLVSTPAITGPFTLPADSGASGAYDSFATAPVGPSYTETTAGGELTGTSQSLRTGTVACDTAALTGACPTGFTPNTSTFGQSGGLFANGLQPSNETNNGVPLTYTPYPLPIFDTTGYALTPWGGPPAYDPDGHGMGARDGINNLGKIDGYAMGFTVFEGVTPAAASSTYTLTLTVPTGISSSGVASYGTVSGTATASGAVTLPAITAPTLVEDGAGGGSFVVTLPAGVTEALITVSDYGPGGTNGGGEEANCQGSLNPGATASVDFPVVYTIVTHASGTVTLPDAIGPNAEAGAGAGKYSPSPTLCTAAQNTAALGAASPGDAYAVQIVGLDYPGYEMNSIFGSETPTLVGAAGQADITVSIPEYEAAYGSATPYAPLFKKHAVHGALNKSRSATIRH